MEENNQPRKKGCLKAVVIGLLAFFALTIIIVAITDSEKEDSEKDDNATISTAVQEENKSVWASSFYVDEMSGDTTFVKSVQSENTINFSFPYTGGSTFELIVRQKKGKDPEILLSTDNGQFMYSFSSDYLRVKFDENEPFNVTYNTPSDGSATVIFLKSTSRLIKELKKAQKVKIEAPFFQDGRQVIEFEVDGFDL